MCVGGKNVSSGPTKAQMIKGMSDAGLQAKLADPRGMYAKKDAQFAAYEAKLKADYAKQQQPRVVNGRQLPSRPAPLSPSAQAVQAMKAPAKAVPGQRVNVREPLYKVGSDEYFRQIAIRDQRYDPARRANQLAPYQAEVDSRARIAAELDGIEQERVATAAQQQAEQARIQAEADQKRAQQQAELEAIREQERQRAAAAAAAAAAAQQRNQAASASSSVLMGQSGKQAPTAAVSSGKGRRTAGRRSPGQSSLNIRTASSTGTGAGANLSV